MDALNPKLRERGDWKSRIPATGKPGWTSKIIQVKGVVSQAVRAMMKQGGWGKHKQSISTWG